MGLPRPIRAATLELTQARLDVFDPAEAVDLLARSSINTVVSFAVGYGRGEAYYPSEHAAPHPDLGDRDLVAHVLALAHERGLAFCAYVNSLFGGPEFHAAQPSWTQRWADGRETVQGDAKALCPNSPYRRHVLDVAREVATRYAIDGFYLDEPSLQSWCACDHCRTRFRDDTGFELPLELERGTARGAAFMEWRTDVVAELISDVAGAVRAARDGVEFFAQHAFPLASTAPELRRHLFGPDMSGRMPPQWEGWYRPGFYGQHIVKASAALDIVGLEPWRRFVDQPVWWEGACVSYAKAAGGGKTVLPLMEYPHFPWGLCRLPDDELEVNCADVTANGGDLWFPMYAPDAADREGWRVLKRVFDELDGAVPTDANPVADVAILVSRRSAERFGREQADRRYLDDLTGMILLARELHVPYRLLSAEALAEHSFSGFSTLVLPSAACLDEREAALLRAWVEGGGSLVATGPVATHDASGAHRGGSLLSDALGVELADEMVRAGLGYLVPAGTRLSEVASRYPVRESQPFITLRGADRLLDLAPNWDLFAPPADGQTHPSVTVHRSGAGRTVYCGLPLGTLRRRYEGYECRDVMARMLEAAGTSPSIRPDRVGIDVAVHCWSDDDELRLFLVNTTSVGSAGNVSHLGEQAFTVRGPYTAASHSVRGVPVRSERTGDHLRVALARLGTWDVIPLRHRR